MRQHKLSTGKTILMIAAAIMIVAAAQVFAMTAAEAAVSLGLPAVAGNLLAGILYPVAAIGLVFLLCRKIIKITTNECKITKFSLKPVWCMTAVLIPAMVSITLICTNGHWENNGMDRAGTAALVVGTVMYYGIGTGIVEEIAFRGLIMSALEYRFNKAVAVIAPSVLFGAMHIIGNDLDARSTVQLLTAGSIVGILLSLVAYESGNIWNGALIHAVWNIVDGILHIGNSAYHGAVYNYVLDTDSFLLTGGDFGIEASIVSVGAYMLFIVLVLVLCRKKNTGKDMRNT